MTYTWQSLLKQHTETDNTIHHADKQFMPLPQLGVLQISGNDAQSFLQNLLTNDVDALAACQAQLSGFCNPKGRLAVSCLLICHHADCYWIILPATMCTLLQQRLAIYVLRSSVTINNISNVHACIGLHQTQPACLAGLDLPTEDYRCTEIESTLIIKLPATGLRYLLVTALAEIDTLLAHTLNSFKLTNASVWQQLDIAVGLPAIHPASSEKFTPQQINFELVGGVSFSKGCYPGQEVVARLHYLGKASRRMFTATTAGTHSPVAIASNITNLTGAVAGHVVTVAQMNKHKSVLLVSLKLSELNNDLFIQDTAIIIDKTATASAMALD